MNEQRINAALREATDTENVLIRAGDLSSVGEELKRLFGDRPAVIVADENTYRVAGEHVSRLLGEAGVETLEPYVFPGRPTLYAGYANVEKLVPALRARDAIPVAVGSGTLNDLVKRASYECDRSYVCVGTAASMDGYTAFGASIEKDDKKQTLTCPAPKVMFGELDVLVEAPAWMTASGYADLLGKVTAGADWMIADALGVEEIPSEVWSIVQDPLREWTAAPEELASGSREAVDRITEGLISSGLAMQSYESSRPGSGSEHQFSHLWEGEGLGREEEPPLSHGFKVGVGSIAIAAFYERLLDRDLSELDVEAALQEWPSWEEMERRVRSAYSGSRLEEAAVAESGAKYVEPAELAQRLQKLRGKWPELSGRLRRQLMPAGELGELLRKAGCPTSPTQIGLGWAEFEATYSRAQMLRKRYTALDVALEAGVFHECVEELFAPGGYWAVQKTGG